MLWPNGVRNMHDLMHQLTPGDQDHAGDHDHD
jgi:hypothetical protein